MKLSFIQGVRFIGLGLMFVGVMTGCRQSPGKPGAIGPGGSNIGVPGGNGVPFPVQVSLAAYDEYLYKPLIQPNCSGCHVEHPFHVKLEDSHRYAVEKYIDPNSTSARILFETPSESAILKRVAANHNCGSDECTVEFVSEAIELWIEDLEDAGWEIPKPDYPNTTGEAAFTDASLTQLPVDPAFYLAAPASEATGTNAFATLQNDDPDGPLSAYLGSTPGDDRNNANDAAAGVATFNFDVITPGDYYIWLRVKMSEDGQNSFFISANGGNPTNFTVDATGEDWLWRTVTNNDGDQVPFANLQPGPLTINVQQRSGGAKFNYLLLTPKDDANRDLFVKEYYDVEIDISEQAKVPGAKIVATVWAEAQAEDDVKVIGVAELRIVSDQPLRVKGIRPLINGIFSEGHATWLFVDTVVGGSNERASQLITTGGAVGSTMLADWEKDKLSFSFESIGPAN